MNYNVILIFISNSKIMMSKISAKPNKKFSTIFKSRKISKIIYIKIYFFNKGRDDAIWT